MKKEQLPPKESEKNPKNLKQTKVKEDQSIPSSNNEKPPKKSPEEKQKELELKSKQLNKQKELLEFDAESHFKENIANTDKNSLGPITEKSYYCINCKHSECPLYNEDENQNEHQLIKRAKYLFYDNSLFNSVEKKIDESLTYHQLKQSMKDMVNSSINLLKDELDKIKEKKNQEIDNYFEETDKYLLELKKKCLNTKQSIEDYYKINNRFFNVSISNNLKSNVDKNINLKDDETKEKNSVRTERNNQHTNNNLQELINDMEIDAGETNKDIENTVFLLNFELINLCDTKNLEIIEMLKDLKLKIESFNITFKNELTNNFETVSKFFSFEFEPEKISDYHWDIILRTQKYSEMIQQFRETITEIVKGTRSLEKIKDLIDIFDSKLKKNNKIIYQQKFFQENTGNANSKHKTKGATSPSNERNSSRRKPSLIHTRTNSKRRLYSSRGKSANKLRRGDNYKNNMKVLTLSNDLGLLRLQNNKNENQDSNIGLPAMTSGNIEQKKTPQSPLIQKINEHKKVYIDDVILDNRIVERFFAYSISELFGKHFKYIDPEDEDNYVAANKDNIYLNKNPNYKFNINININNNSSKNSQRNNTSNISKSARGNSMKKYKSMNVKNMVNTRYNNNYNNIDNIQNVNNNNAVFNLKNSVGLNKNNFYNNNVSSSNLSHLGKQEMDKFDANQYNVKSVSYLANYTNRYNSLKERAKPVIGTNQIQLFSPNNHKLIRKVTNLNREEHGYSLFPEGCRHILVDDNLYIIGGTNHVRVPISIVLVYNIISGILTRLSDLNNTHSYHTVEYLENYNSIICIGGENSSSCEIMDLEDKKWHKLPSLNIPRANCNIYFNNITGELFVLFGICGIMSEKTNNYSDSIEVLVLNNISQGWLKVDYYKTPGLNLKVNYCMTIPFTRNQLLIYGGSNMRTFRENIFALFHMIRSECNKVDTQTMELIKLEEKKSRLVDLALTKLG